LLPGNGSQLRLLFRKCRIRKEGRKEGRKEVKGKQDRKKENRYGSAQRRKAKEKNAKK
jgi:hypothetical protein